MARSNNPHRRRVWFKSLLGASNQAKLRSVQKPQMAYHVCRGIDPSYHEGEYRVQADFLKEDRYLGRNLQVVATYRNGQPVKAEGPPTPHPDAFNAGSGRGGFEYPD